MYSLYEHFNVVINIVTNFDFSLCYKAKDAYLISINVKYLFISKCMC